MPAKKSPPKDAAHVRLSLHVASEDINLADKLCKATGETRAAVLRDAIRRGLRQVLEERQEMKALSKI